MLLLSRSLPSSSSPSLLVLVAVVVTLLSSRGRLASVKESDDDVVAGASFYCSFPFPSATAYVMPPAGAATFSAASLAGRLTEGRGRGNRMTMTMGEGEVAAADGGAWEGDLSDRRAALQKMALTTTTAALTTAAAWSGAAGGWVPPAAAESTSSVAATAAAVVTDRIYIDIKGLPSSSSSGDTVDIQGNAASAATATTKRIVIGLFGRDAPNSADKIKQLAADKNSPSPGLPAPCRPKEIRSLQREQLEANKVYNSCMESEDQGVSLRYSTIWRIVPNERIDVGAVTGRFVSRQYPAWYEDEENGNLKHDRPGVVSVRRGNDGGFGFTIYPGGGGGAGRLQLDEDNIVVGQVLEGMDVVEQLSTGVPVIASSKVNYMGLTGGTTTKNAPTRSCRYGGPMYCNENKPLLKLTLADVGIL